MAAAAGAEPSTKEVEDLVRFLRLIEVEGPSADNQITYDGLLAAAMAAHPTAIVARLKSGEISMAGVLQPR